MAGTGRRKGRHARLSEIETKITRLNTEEETALQGASEAEIQATKYSTRRGQLPDGLNST
jgi:hypothetical protein